MKEETTKKQTCEEFFQEIVGGFPKPCYILLKIDKKGQLSPLSVSIDGTAMSLTESAKGSNNIAYVG